MVSRQNRGKIDDIHSVEEHTPSKVSENQSQTCLGVSPIHRCLSSILLAD